MNLAKNKLYLYIRRVFNILLLEFNFFPSVIVGILKQPEQTDEKKMNKSQIFKIKYDREIRKEALKEVCGK